jgi:ribosome biogenesis GTPase
MGGAKTKNTSSGRIVAAFGRRFLVDTGQAVVACVPRGKKAELACGDVVEFVLTSAGEGVIEGEPARASLFFRSVAHRKKLFAANVGQLAVVVAAAPSFSDELLTRVLVASENAGLKSFLIFNKIDLETEAAAARERLQPFEAAGYEVLLISAKRDVHSVRDRLHGEATVLVGQSGMGKSTLINALVPEADARTREISTFLDSGKHTTTHARLYRTDAESSIVDTPGMQEFGLAHLSWREISAGFPEFRPLMGQCRFPDCRHLSEPGCAIAAAEPEKIAPRRLELYRRIVKTEHPV